MFKYELPLKLDLQLFAEEDNGDNDLSGEDELAAAIKSLLESDEQDDEEEIVEDESEEESEEDEQEDETADDEEDEQEDDDQESDKDKGKKREQSKEENAKFAAQRRQKEIEDKVAAELERVKQESPEYQLAKMLSDAYGVTPEVALAQMKEEALKKQAETTGIPIEHLKAQEVTNAKVTSLETEINNLRFQNWQNQIKLDTEKLKGQYQMLTEEDFDKATDYILNVARNVNLPLEDAVYAVHGKKIIDHLANSKVQDKLADESGRKKKTPPAPNNGKPSKVINATAEEKYIAKAMGMTIEDYLKHKI